ncbi:TPA: hypothetical protein DDW35_07010, partial [Candidatus Sumerlaeota bacterium]|nr:hypothetical protein [Candidatus Sumerlaeota bacterium]
LGGGPFCLSAQFSMRRAVTLVEVIVAIAIICLLATVSLASYNTYYRRSVVNLQAAKFQQLCATARTWAIQNGGNYAAVMVNAGTTNAAMWIDRVDTDELTTTGLTGVKLTTPERVHSLVYVTSGTKTVSSTAIDDYVPAERRTFVFRSDGTSQYGYIDFWHQADNPALVTTKKVRLSIFPTGAVRITDPL